MIFSKNTLYGLVALTLTVSFTAWAEKASWHGFAAQGLIQAKGSNFVNDDGEVSTRLTEMGLNTSYRLTPKLRIAGQAIYVNGGNRYPEGVRLDYAFLDWQAYSDLNAQVNVHIGRNKNYHRLYSSTRDVPFTRPSVVLPQSLYLDVFRDVSIGTDGIYVRSQFSNHLGDWQLNWNYGRASINRKQTRLFVGAQAQGRLKLAYEHQGSVNFQPRLSNYQFGGGFVDSKFTYDAAQGEGLIDGEGDIKAVIVHFQYSGEHWELTSEVQNLRFVLKDFMSPGISTDATAQGGYIQGRYFIREDLTALLRLDMYDRDREDRDGRRNEQLTGLPARFGFMDMATIGLSWQFADRWRLQAEYHRVKGTGRLAPFLMPDRKNNSNEYWHIGALQLMHWF